MNSRALLRKPRGAQDSWCIPGVFLVYSWCTPGALLVHLWFTSGALLVHSWCTPGASLVHFWCTSGALLVHSWCTPGALSVHSWCTLGAFKGFPTGNCFASERKPRSSAQKRLDRLSPTYKPERELHRFRKEASILRTETFGSHSVKARANDPPHENVLDRPRNYHLYHRKGRNHNQAAAEYPSDAPNREVDERTWGPSGTKSCWNLSLREYSDVHTQNCTCGT